MADSSESLGGYPQTGAQNPLPICISTLRMGGGFWRSRGCGVKGYTVEMSGCDLELKEYRAQRRAYAKKNPKEFAYSARACLRRYNLAHPERARQRFGRYSAKSRGLGCVFLNQFFPNCEGHHLDKNNIAYIPEALHHSVPHNIWTGRNMEAINAKVCAWLTEGWT
jgi:hypothetical protein